MNLEAEAAPATVQADAPRPALDVLGSSRVLGVESSAKKPDTIASLFCFLIYQAGVEDEQRDLG